MTKDEIDIAPEHKHNEQSSHRKRPGNDVSQLIPILRDHDNPLRLYFLGVFFGGGTVVDESSDITISFGARTSIELYLFLRSYGVSLPKLRILNRKAISNQRGGHTAKVTWSSSNTRLRKILSRITLHWKKSIFRPHEKSKRRTSIALFLLGFIWSAGHILFQSIGNEKFCFHGVDIYASSKKPLNYIRTELTAHGIDNSQVRKVKNSPKHLVIDHSPRFKKLLLDGLVELQRLGTPVPGKLELLLNTLVNQSTIPIDYLPPCFSTSLSKLLGKQGHMHPIFAPVAQDFFSLSIYQINVILKALGHKSIKSTLDFDLIQFVKWTFNYMRKLPSITPCQDLFILYTEKCIQRGEKTQEVPIGDDPKTKIWKGYIIYDDYGLTFSEVE